MTTLRRISSRFFVPQQAASRIHERECPTVLAEQKLGAHEYLSVTEDYLIGGRTPVGILADLASGMLNLLEARYGALWDNEQAQPPPIPSLSVSTRAF